MTLAGFYTLPNKANRMCSQFRAFGLTSLTHPCWFCFLWFKWFDLRCLCSIYTNFMCSPLGGYKLKLSYPPAPPPPNPPAPLVTDVDRNWNKYSVIDCDNHTHNKAMDIGPLTTHDFDGCRGVPNRSLPLRDSTVSITILHSPARVLLQVTTPRRSSN